MELVRDKRVKDAYMNSTIQNMFRRGELRKDHPLQRRPDQWNKNDKDGLIVTVLKDEDIDSIKVCEQLTENGIALWVIDGLQRLTVLNSYRNGVFKLGKKIEFPILLYQKVKRDGKGTIIKDEYNNYIYEMTEFDLRGKGYEDLPEELKEKFDNYKIDVVKHLDCSEEEIGYHIRRYNRQKSMNVSQNAITYMDNIAREVKKISYNNSFFREYDIYTEKEKNNGTIDRIVIETVMCMYHLEHWQKQSRRMGAYLNRFSDKREFERLSANLQRLGNIYDKHFHSIFTPKDSFIWFTLFERFTALPFEDVKFADFLTAFQDGLCSRKVNGESFYEIDKKKSTKDKAIIMRKLALLETLLYEFLHINKKDMEELNVFHFVRDHVDQNVTWEDLEQYEEVFEDLTVRADHSSRLFDRRNRPSLIAMVAYSFACDRDLDDWIIDFFRRKHTYLSNQKKNYLDMQEDFFQFLDK